MWAILRRCKFPAFRAAPYVGEVSKLVAKHESCGVVVRCCSVAAKRVFGLVAHIDAGKTTTSERLLYFAGGIPRLGNVDSGDTTLDFLPAERERGITINSAAISFKWNDHELFLVDSPGHLDFTYEVQRSLRVMDGVVVVLDAVSGVQAQTETVWRQADQYSLPRLVFVNKMDREGADFQNAVFSLKRRFSARFAPVHFPLVCSGNQLTGFVDLITMDIVQRPTDAARSSRPSRELSRVPCSSYEFESGDIESEVLAAREHLIETVADCDDGIMEKWVVGHSIDTHHLRRSLRKATVTGELVPVLCGSSLKNFGAQSLLDAIVDFLPNPAEIPPLEGHGLEGSSETVPVDTKGPMLALAFKVVHDPHRGKVVYFRSFSGAMCFARNPLYNLTAGRKEMPTALLRVMADRTIPVDNVATGDIFAAMGCKYTRTGDTISSSPRSNGKLKQKSGVQVCLKGVPSPPPVISVALEADSLSQEREMNFALETLLAEDPSLHLSVDPLTGETLLSGMGQLHLQIAVEQLSKILKASVQSSRPRVAYRETITAPVEHEEHYDEIIGSERLTSTLKVSVQPRRSSTTVADENNPQHTFTNNLVCMSKSLQDIPDLAGQVSEAVAACLMRGPLLGLPTTGIEAKVLSDVHDLNVVGHASILACAASAVRNALGKAEGVLMEPVMKVTCVVPELNAGDVISDLTHSTARRGIIESVGQQTAETLVGAESFVNISAKVPLEGLMDWATKLRSLTKGRGELNMEFDSYQPVSKSRSDQIVDSQLS